MPGAALGLKLLLQLVGQEWEYGGELGWLLESHDERVCGSGLAFKLGFQLKRRLVRRRWLRRILWSGMGWRDRPAGSLTRVVRCVARSGREKGCKRVGLGCWFHW